MPANPDSPVSAREELLEEIGARVADSSPAAVNYRRALLALEVLAESRDGGSASAPRCAEALAILRGEKP